MYSEYIFTTSEVHTTTLLKTILLLFHHLQDIAAAFILFLFK
jgi:hypothetical protein